MATLDVSIHASRGGRDIAHFAGKESIMGFNPRVPRGTRLRLALKALARLGFNPRVPRGTRLAPRAQGTGASGFQSTRPAGDATWPITRITSPNNSFNPRVPRGTRRPRGF